MRLIYFLAGTFINTFGITQPTEKVRKQAAIFIMVLLLILLGGLAVLGYVIHTVIS